MKHFIALMFATATMFGQNIDPEDDSALPRYEIRHAKTLAGAATTSTIQGNNNNAPIWFEKVTVWCSVATTLTFTQNGTAATTTSVAVPIPMGTAYANPPDGFIDSNVGAGTTRFTYSLAAGQNQPFKMKMYYIPPNAGGSKNVNITTSSITGDCTFQWKLRNQLR